MSVQRWLLSKTISRALFLALGLTTISPTISHSATASTSVSNPAKTVLPSTNVIPNKETITFDLLSEEDLSRYRKIFALQAQGRWKDADKRISRLDDKVLLGHVLAQRYLHPTAYRSKYKELKAWLSNYADHPQADIIYKLALQRRPKNHARPKRPIHFKSAAYRAHGKNYSYRTSKKHSKEDRKKALRLKAQLKRNVLNTRLSITEDVLKSAKAKRLLDPIEINETYARLAAAWYYYNNDQKAYDLASKATQSRKYVPSADWIAGLAAWRMGEIEKARSHFTHLAQATRANGWMRSAGAYWAARTNLKLKSPQNVSKNLYVAAEYPRTFYGILARRALGLDLTFNEDARLLARSTSETLQNHAPSRRALAFLQLDKRQEAQQELKRLIGSLDGDEIHAFIRLTEQAGMPELAFRLGA